MKKIKILLASANYPNDYYLWGPWNKEANVVIANSEEIVTETIAPLPHSLPFKFIPYYQISKIPLLENGLEGKIHRPRFLYLMPKKFFYGYEGSFYRRSVEKYSKNLQKPDLVHCHHVYPDGYGFMNLCEKWNVPLIVDVHRGNLFTEFLENKALSSKISETLKFASKIICISREIKDLAIDWGINNEKLEIIPLGIDINSFKSLNNDIIKEKLSINEKKVILYVGELIKRKGLNYLVKAISYLSDDIKNDLKVIIIGEGEEKSYLDKLCQKLGLESIFEFKGIVDRNNIPYYYSIADIFVLPSLSEGRPVVIYEAMASECAIVASNVDGIPEQVKDKYNGFLVEPTNIEDLTDKIGFLMENEEIMQKMKKNSRKRIIEEGWTWEVYSKKIIEIYNELLDG